VPHSNVTVHDNKLFLTHASGRSLVEVLKVASFCELRLMMLPPLLPKSELEDPLSVFQRVVKTIYLGPLLLVISCNHLRMK